MSTFCINCGIGEEERLNTHESPLGRLCTKCYDLLAEEYGWGPRLKSLRELFATPIKVEVFIGADLKTTRNPDGSITIHLPTEDDDPAGNMETDYPQDRPHDQLDDPHNQGLDH